MVNRRQVQVQCEGGTLTVWYSQNAFTPRLEQMARDLTSSPDEAASKALCVLLSRLILDWDLTEEDEVTKVPITQDSLLDLPIKLLTDVISTINKDISPNESTPERSGSFS